MTERDDERRVHESQAARAEEDTRARQDRGRPPFTGHPPIIITGGAAFRARGKDDDPTVGGAEDILVMFDGEDVNRHYEPEHPPSYTSGLRLIDFIKVESETAGHTCVEVRGNYRIVVTDKHRNNGNESSIIIDATSNARIDITFPHGEYERKHRDGKPKMLLGELKKIKSMEVFDSAGRLVHDCEIAKSDRNVRIAICDDGCVGG